MYGMLLLTVLNIGGEAPDCHRAVRGSPYTVSYYHPLVLQTDTVAFAGNWTGEWKNSLGEKGKDTLDLTEDADGKLSGTWTGTVKVTGKRINKNTIELQGKTEQRSYQITATVKNGVMTLKYVVTRLNMDGSYNGEATLERE